MSQEVELVSKEVAVYSDMVSSELTALKSLSSYLNNFTFSLSECTSRIVVMKEEAEVSCLAVSLNFCWFAGGIGSSVKVYCYDKHDLVFSYLHSSSVNSVAFSPSNQLLASGSSDKSIKVFNILKQSLEHEFTGHTNSVQSVMFNRSSHLIVSGSSDNSIIIWNLYSKSIEFQLKGHNSGINVVCFDKDSKYIASASNCIKIWSVDEQKELFTLVNDSNFYYSLAFSPNTQYIAGGNSENTLIIWNLLNKQEEMRFTGFESFVFSICFTFDGHYIISGSADSQVKIWNLREKREELPLLSHNGKVYCVQVSPDGRKIFSGSSDGELKILNFQENFEKVEENLKLSVGVIKLKISPSGKFIVLVLNDRTFRVWSLFLKSYVCNSKTNWTSTYSVEVSQNEKWTCFGTSEKAIRVFSFLDGNLEFGLEGHEDCVKAVCFSTDEKWLASGSGDRTVRVWDLEQKSEYFCLLGHLGEVLAVQFSRDNSKVVSGSSDKIVKIWDFNSKTLLFDLFGHVDSVDMLFLTSSSDYLISTSADRTIRLWSLEYKREEFFVPLEETVQDACLDTNSGFFATCNKFSIKIWNLQEKRLEFSINEPLGQLKSISFGNEGKYLTAAFDNKKVFQYRLKDNPKNSVIKDALSFDYHKLAKYSEGSVIVLSTINPAEKSKIPIQERVSFMAISPNSLYLAIAGQESCIKVYSVQEKSLRFELKTFHFPAWSIFFTENSHLVLINSNNAETRVFDLSSSTEIPMLNEKILKNDENLDLSSLFDPGFSAPLTYFNFLYGISSSQYSKISASSLDYPFTNLKFTGLHILTALSRTDIIQSLSRTYNFTLRTDLYGNSPIYYSIKLYDQKTTDFLLNYLIMVVEKGLGHVVKPSFFALKRDLSVIIANSSRFLNSFFSVCLEAKTQTAHFGISKSKLPSVRVLDTSGSVFEDFAANGNFEELRPLEFQVSLFPIQSGTGSSGSLNLLKSLLACTNSEIYETDFIQALVQSSWSRSLTLIYLYTLLIWANLFFLVLLIDPNFTTLPIIISFISCNFLLLLWEIVQFSEATLTYFNDPWNAIDVLRLGFSFTYGGLLLSSYSHPYLLWVTLAFNVIRGLTGFRAFDATRYYIGLISMSLSNTCPFLFIFVYTNLSFGVLLTASGSAPELSFESLWVNVFNLDLGEVSILASKELSLSYVTFLLACVINVILMLNMLISILGDSFDEFQSQAVFYNYTEMTKVISEVEQIKNFFSDSNRLAYLHVCFPAYRNLDDTWKGKVVDFRRQLEQLHSSMSKGFEKAAENSELQKTQLKNDQSTLNLALRQLEYSLLKKIEPQFASINQRISSLEHSLSSLPKPNPS